MVVIIIIIGKRASEASETQSGTTNLRTGHTCAEMEK